MTGIRPDPIILASDPVEIASYMEQMPEPLDVVEKMRESAAGRSPIAVVEDTFFNSMAPIRRLEKELNDGELGIGAESAFKNAEMAVNDSGRQELLLYAGAAKFGEHGEYTVNPDTIGLRDIFDLAAGNADPDQRGQRLVDWMQWMIARRAKDLLDTGKVEKMPITRDEIDAALAKEQYGFTEAAREWKKFNDANLDFLEESGRISRAQKEAMQADEFYVPFYRADQRVDGSSPDLVLPPSYVGGATTAGTLLARDPNIKKMIGGDKMRIQNLMTNMIRNSQSTVAAGMRNRAANKVFDLMQQADMADVVPLTPTKPNENAVRVWRDGEESWIVPKGLHAKPLMMALSTLNPRQLNVWERMLSDISSIFRQGITLTPPFMIRNAIRGAVSAGMLTTGANLTAHNNTFTGFMDAMQNKGATQAFKAQAGMGDFRFGNRDIGFGENDILLDFGVYSDPSALQKTGYRFRQFMNAMERVGTATELADRVAAYKTMISRGVRADEAAYQTLSIMNYGRRGNSQALRTLLPLVPFLNARLQGWSRMMEGAVGPTQAYNNRVRALGQLVLTGAAYTTLAGLIWGWNASDEERREKYANEPLWRRLNYHTVYVGDKSLYIPKAFELGHLFTSIPEAYGDSVRGDFPDESVGGSALKIAQDTVLFNAIPQAMMPVLEITTNYDFFRGRPIEGLREQRLLPEARTSGAGALMTTLFQRMGISEETRISPTMAEHFLSGYGGIYYVMLNTAFDIVAADAGLMPKNPEGAFGDVPILSPAMNRAFGSFLKDTPEQTTRFIENFYETKRRVEQLYATARDARNAGDVEYFNDIVSRAPLAKQANKLMNRAGREMSDINAQLRLLRRDTKLSRQEKRARLRSLIQRRNKISRQMVETIWKMEQEQGVTFREAS